MLSLPHLTDLGDEGQRAGSQRPRSPLSVSLHSQAVTQCHALISSPHPHPKGPLQLRPLFPWRTRASSALVVCPLMGPQQGCQTYQTNNLFTVRYVPCCVGKVLVLKFFAVGHLKFKSKWASCLCSGDPIRDLDRPLL